MACSGGKLDWWKLLNGGAVDAEIEQATWSCHRIPVLCNLCLSTMVQGVDSTLGQAADWRSGGQAAEWSYFTRVSFPVVGSRRITMLSMPVINRGDNVLSA